MSEVFSKSNDGQIQQNGLIMSTDEVVDYLNISNNVIGSLQYENAQLRKENEQLKKENQRVYGILEDGGVLLTRKQLLDVIGEDKCDMFFREQATITALKEENEQLKKEYKIAIDEMVTDYKKLEKENEQLQKELQRFKKYVFSQDNILCYKCEHCIKKDIYVVDCEMKGKVDVHGLCSLFREVKV